MTEIKIYRSRNASIKVSHSYKNIKNVFQKPDNWKIQLKKQWKILMKSAWCIRKVVTQKSWYMIKQMKLLRNILNHFFYWCQIGLQISIKGSDFMFLFTYCTYYYLTCWIIYRFIDSPDLIINKNSTINPISKNDNKCFQYAPTVALIHEKIEKFFERITKIKLFISEISSRKR